MILKLLRLRSLHSKKIDWWARNTLRDIARLESEKVLDEDEAWALRAVVLRARADKIRSSDFSSRFSDADLNLDILEPISAEPPST